MELEAAFDAHHPALYRFLVRLCGDEELAADAAQEAFLRLAERPPSDPGNVRAWLYTVAGNFVRDTARQRRRRLEILYEAPERAPVADQPATPEIYVERAELARFVRDALGELSIKERTILLMRAEGFSYRDVAKAVDVSTNSVGVMAARALRKLSTVLEPDKARLA